MSILKTATKGGLAALLLGATTAGAHAWPAVAATALNMRAGPGTHFHVVAVLHRDERVDVEYCRADWCFAHSRDASGWAVQTYLVRAGYSDPAPQRPPSWRHHPDPRDDEDDRGSRVCFHDRNGSVCFGN